MVVFQPRIGTPPTNGGLESKGASGEHMPSASRHQHDMVNPIDDLGHQDLAAPIRSLARPLGDKPIPTGFLEGNNFRASLLGRLQKAGTLHQRSRTSGERILLEANKLNARHVPDQNPPGTLLLEEQDHCMQSCGIGGGREGIAGIADGFDQNRITAAQPCEIGRLLGGTADRRRDIARSLTGSRRRQRDPRATSRRKRRRFWTGRRGVADTTREREGRDARTRNLVKSSSGNHAPDYGGGGNG